MATREWHEREVLWQQDNGMQARGKFNGNSIMALEGSFMATG